MSQIKRVWAREILDSRGMPTVEAAVMLDNGYVAVASSPSGTSTGSHEAVELRDNDPEHYKGTGVLKAVENVNTKINPILVGKDPIQQFQIDKLMCDLDGTKNKSNIGGNAILAVSEAVAKVGAMAQRQPLYRHVNNLLSTLGYKTSLKIPTPLFNMINGGLHGAGNLDFQEFHVIPATTKAYEDALNIGVTVFMTIGANLQRKGAIHSVGAEGGYAPNLFTNVDALEILVESIKEAGYSIGRDVFLGLDVAASTFYNGTTYKIKDKNSPLDDWQLIDFYKDINQRYRLAIIEDPFAEDDWTSWNKITSSTSHETIIVGDDLLVTNKERIQKAIENKSCNGILVKPNQIGTVTETLEVIKMARDANWKMVVSHRSGETNDAFIADFAVGVGSDYVKFGAPNRGERVAKYNRMLTINQELKYA